MKIETKVEETGYTLFLVGGRRVLGYQHVGGKHYFIRSDRPALTLVSAKQASRLILTVLKDGGDLVEFLDGGYRLPEED